MVRRPLEYATLSFHIISPSILPLMSGGMVNGPSPLSALQKFEQRITSLSTNQAHFVMNVCDISHAVRTQISHP